MSRLSDAFVVIGGMREHARRGHTDLDNFDGQIGFIKLLLEGASVLEKVETANSLQSGEASSVCDSPHGAWCYDVAELFGEKYAAMLLDELGHADVEAAVLHATGITPEQLGQILRPAPCRTVPSLITDRFVCYDIQYVHLFTDGEQEWTVEACSSSTASAGWCGSMWTLYGRYEENGLRLAQAVYDAESYRDVADMYTRLTGKEAGLYEPADIFNLPS